MELSRAEIQRCYRERKKAKEGEAYMARERERTTKYYVPSRELSSRDRKERNRKRLTSNRRNRQEKRELRQKPTLELKFNFPNKVNGPRSRIRNTVANQSNKIKTLQENLHKMETKYRSLMRKNQRQNMKTSMSNTPRSKAVRDLVQAGINPKRTEGLRRRLTFSYAINDEIKQTTLSRNKNAKKIVEVVVGSRILRKYKMINMAAKELNLNRKRLADVTDKILKISRKKRSLKEQGKYKQQVIDFMERCDNSTVHPNKQEVKM